MGREWLPIAEPLTRGMVEGYESEGKKYNGGGGVKRRVTCLKLV